MVKLLSKVADENKWYVGVENEPVMGTIHLDDKGTAVFSPEGLAYEISSLLPILTLMNGLENAGRLRQAVAAGK
jgi:hypothetical protein